MVLIGSIFPNDQLFKFYIWFPNIEYKLCFLDTTAVFPIYAHGTNLFWLAIFFPQWSMLYI